MIKWKFLEMHKVEVSNSREEQEREEEKEEWEQEERKQRQDQQGCELDPQNQPYVLNGLLGAPAAAAPPLTSDRQGTASLLRTITTVTPESLHNTD